MSRLLFRVSALLLFLAPTLAWAQGVLIVVDPHEHVRLPRPIIIWPPPHPHPHPHPIPHPRPTPPPATYKIEKLDVQAKLVDQVAQVQMSQSFVNTGSRQMEVSFVFPLPYDGAIEQMTLMVDGKEYSARLLDAKEARKMYEEIVRKNKDPALLEWMGAGLFKTSVFPVPAGAKRTVSLRYSQLCRKAEGLTDFLFPLSTAKYTSHAVEEVNIRVTVESGIDIKNIYSPTHKIKIKRPDDRHATVTYNVEKEVPSSDFRLLYGVNAKKVGTQVLSYRPDNKEDGFFLLLASPQIKAADEKPAKKTVLFVVDRSGSMSGKKIEQARGAAKFVLNNLNEGDLFNIVAYDSQIESFQPELQRYDDATRKKALGFIEGLYAGGSTNIDQALNTALSQLQDSKSPNYVIFLTDGLPTAGETNEMKIVDNAKKENRVRARIFTFGVGYDVNSRLLD
ncbi:MAG: VWA domain-containing protein, partial [Planctomycetes bacterium]|nr:VWA domain-containing protein [Planctomycetota bacterium]